MSLSIIDRIKILSKDDLSTLELQTCLNTIHSQKPLSDPDTLLLSSTLLNKIIPQTYILLEQSTRTVLQSLFASRIGISQLIQSIKLNSNNKNTYLYIDIFINVIQNELEDLINEFYSSKGVNLKDWKSLLSFKILDCLGMILIWLLDNNECPKNINLSRNKINQIIENYIVKSTTILVNNSNEEENISEYIRQIINSFFLKDSENVFNVIINNWNNCIKLYTNFKSSNKKNEFHFIASQKSFLLAIIDVMDKRLNQPKLIKPWFQFIDILLTKIKFHDIKNTILLRCEKNVNIINSYIWIKSLDNIIDIDYINKLIKKFGNKEYMMNTSINNQINFTKFIILILKNLSINSIKNLSYEISFLEAISCRLESTSLNMRELGMLVADFVYIRINEKPMFSISDYNVKRDNFMEIFKILDNSISINNEIISIDSIILEMNNQLKTQNKSSINKEIIPKMTPIMIDMDYISDNEDSDLDDPTVERKATIAKPVFLKDLLHYLITDPQKDTTAFDKRGIAFSIGIEMVRIKKNTAEIKYYSKKLIDAALDLENIGFPIREGENFDKDQIKIAFDSWKLSFMIAIFTSEPDIIFEYLLKGFIQNDWSIPTRIQVLTCIGLSCRELCGIEDDFIWGKNNLEKVVPKKLLGPGHELFMMLDKNETTFVNKIENKYKNKIIDIEDEKKEEKLINALESIGISNGKVIHRSKKIDIDKENADFEMIKNKTKYTTFINKKLPKIYFSMTALWQEVNSFTLGKGFKVGMMSEYLNSHFIDILSMVYSCGIPSSIELIDMTIEQLSVIEGQLMNIRISSEFPILLFKSIINGLQSLLIDNDRTFSVLKSSSGLEITTLFESYSQVLADAPVLEEPTRSISLFVLEKLQEYSLINNIR